MLARSLAAKGIYPAVDVLESTSTMLQPWIVGDAHYACAQRPRLTVNRARKMERFLSPSSFVTRLVADVFVLDSWPLGSTCSLDWF